MRVLGLFAHPVETRFLAAVHARAVETLSAGGQSVDDCDLYAETFDPRLTRAERLASHDLDADRPAVRPYVDRLRAAVTRLPLGQSVGAPRRCLAQHDMNRATDAAHRRFLERVAAEMERFG